MNTKPLYILTQDNGDGSYSHRFTFDTAWIQEQHKLDNAGELGCEDLGVDGDGFHYTVIQVPEDATYDSLAIGPYQRVGQDIV